jgi:hypothetical protein
MSVIPPTEAELIWRARGADETTIETTLRVLALAAERHRAALASARAAITRGANATDLAAAADALKQASTTCWELRKAIGEAIKLGLEPSK